MQALKPLVEKIAEINRLEDSYIKQANLEAAEGGSGSDTPSSPPAEEISGQLKLLRAQFSQLLIRARSQHPMVSIVMLGLEPGFDGDVFPQLDKVIDRIHKRGIRLADGRFFGPKMIVMPVSTTGVKEAPNLVAFVEGAIPRPMSTPKGYRVTVVGVESSDIREFARDLLIEWRRRIAATQAHR